MNQQGYRSYYYDQETGLYYLNSRYYNPEFGRFINADDPAIATIELENNYNKNLYAYTDNNPINRIDTQGEFWQAIALVNPVTAVIAIAAVVILVPVIQDMAKMLPAISIALPSIDAGKLVPSNKPTAPVTKPSTTAPAPSVNIGSGLNSIAKGYGIGQCVQAADAMTNYLKKNNKNFRIVELYFPVAYKGMVGSNRYGPNLAISFTGIHRGVLYNGNVHCVIYPEGLPLSVWQNSFYDGMGRTGFIRYIN